MRTNPFFLILVLAISCTLKSPDKSNLQALEAIAEDTTASKHNCEFVFDPEAAIRCAKVADDISGYGGEWPEGTNSTVFFQLAETNKNLREINFCFVKIDSLTPSIGKIENLEKLYLTAGTIKRIPDAIGKLKKLHTLILGDSKTECGGNPVQFISPQIGNCDSLKYLGLAFSEVSDLPVELLKCKKLKTIDLSGNKKMDLKKLTKIRERFNGVEIISHLK